MTRGEWENLKAINRAIFWSLASICGFVYVIKLLLLLDLL